MQQPLKYGLWALVLALTLSCHSKKTADPSDAGDAAPKETQTPVTVTNISTAPLSDSILLNATANFIQSNIVKSNINGYVESVNIKPGQYTPPGKTLFVLITKEAKSLGNAINKLDPSFHFTGVVRISSPQSGFVTQLNHQIGDYVQDGEQLAVINDSKSFGFILNVPYEYRRYISINKPAQVILPDGTLLNGSIGYMMPTIDSTSQTQTVLVKVNSGFAIPQNLIAKVRILKTEKTHTQSLPKQAVLTDESQSSFWVMKMVDSVTAVKVPVIKGMESASLVEIVSPHFKTDDKILLTGNYGLPDTAKVVIVKGEE